VQQHGLQGSVRFAGPLADVRADDQGLGSRRAAVALRGASGCRRSKRWRAGVPVVASAVGGLLDFPCRRRQTPACVRHRIRRSWPPAIGPLLTDTRRRRARLAARAPRRPLCRTTTSRSSSAACARCSIAWRGRDEPATAGGRLSFLVRQRLGDRSTAASAVMLVALLMIAGRFPAGIGVRPSSRSRWRSPTIIETLMDIGLGPRHRAHRGRATARAPGALFRHCARPQDRVGGAGG